MAHRAAFNGTLSLPMGGGIYGHMIIIGGPFETSAKTDHTFNINLKAEGTSQPFDANLPIEDYNVPKDLDMLNFVIREAITAALDGKIIWAGCMGGMGRTGLFFAVLAKGLGQTDPVAFVRKHYYSHAVETAGQKAFIADYDASWIEPFIENSYGRKHDVFLSPEVIEMAHPVTAESVWVKVKGFFKNLF